MHDSVDPRGAPLLDPQDETPGAPAGTYAALAALTHSGPVDEVALRSMLSFADSRRDCSDFRMIAILRLLFKAGDRMPAALRERTERTVLNFKYWIDEPGVDAMCYWSENHHLLFAASEYLAGSLYPERRFGNDGRTGAAHRSRALDRLTGWLWQRFHYGFSEWLSSVYYEQDVAALVVLIDHAGDPLLVERCSMVLDLLLLDGALHRFKSTFVASAGRLYEEEKFRPTSAAMVPLLNHAFSPSGATRADHVDWNTLGALFLLRDGYEVPPVLAEIAHSSRPALIRTSHGLTTEEANTLYDDRYDPDTTGALLWQMEAFVRPDTIRATMRAMRAWRLFSNPFLSDLSALSQVPDAALPAIVRIARPSVSGTALLRANVQTYRTPAYLLSSAQHYCPGEFGDQQHIWHASLPGGIAVFATHPGSALVENATRQRTPSAWVGNGINPDVGQDGPVLVARYDLRGWHGLGERRRAAYTHLHFPFVDFDETRLGSTWVAGRSGNTYIGVASALRLDRVGESELRQRGKVTGYGVICADTDDFVTMDAFVEAVRTQELSVDRHGLHFLTGRGTYELEDGRLRRDGQPFATGYPRYSAPWVDAERKADTIHVRGETGELRLSWTSGRSVIALA